MDRRISITDVTQGRRDRALVVPHYERDALHGIALVASEFNDSQISVHGPRGCTSQLVEAMNVQSQQVNYYHFGMSPKDVVLGGVRRLRPKLTKAAGSYTREGILFLATTCTAELIADDVDSVVRELEGTAPVLKVTGGLEGDRLSGINATLEALVRRFGQPGDGREPGLVNLIGNVGGGREWHGDVHELARVLERLGLRANPLACESRLRHVVAAPRAVATVLTTSDVGGDAAGWLEKSHGVPVAVSPFGLPIGLRGTERWLRVLAAAAGVAPDVVDDVIADEESEVLRQVRLRLRDEIYIAGVARLKGLPVAVVADGTVALSWMRFLVEELAMRPVLLGAHRAPAAGADELLAWWATARDGAVELSRPTPDEVADALRQAKPALVLGSSVERELLDRAGGGTFLHIAYPNTHYVTFTDAPYLGYRGVARVAEDILNRIPWAAGEETS